MSKVKRTKAQKNEALSIQLERAANQGHYLERLENMAACLYDRQDIMGCVLALKQIHAFSNCKPDCSDAIQLDISMRILGHLKYRLGFTVKQMSRLWYGVSYESRGQYKLKFPYEHNGTHEMKSDTTYARGN